MEAVIFDLDGTLVDSFRDIAVSVNLLLAEFSLAPLADEAVRPCIGKGVRHLVTEALRLSGAEEADAAQALRRYRDIYETHALESTRPYAGVPALLDSLRGVPLAVLSNKPEQACRQLLAHFGLLALFTAVAGGDSFAEMKPSPVPVLGLAQALGVRAEDALLVGDSTYDIEAGKKAGALTCAVYYGFQDKGALDACGPDYSAADPAALGALLRSLLTRSSSKIPTGEGDKTDRR